MPAHQANSQITHIVDGFAGHGLNRPECAVAHSSGLLLMPNWLDNGGISLISPNNQTHTLFAKGTFAIRANGIALEEQGHVLLAHLGDTEGGIFRLSPNGSLTPVVTTVNGEPMPPANFVVKDSAGRLWITVSTRKTPRASDYRRGANTGFIAVAMPGESDARIVADHLGYTNECVVDEANACVYVNETFARKLSVYDMDGSNLPKLSNRRTVCEFSIGTYPDGLALDSEGCLWVTSIVSNRIIKVQSDGTQALFFEDCKNEHVLWAEQAYNQDALGREHLDTAQSEHMKNISNVAFGGADLKTLYIGNLLGNTLPYIKTQTAGKPMVHWQAQLGALERYLD